MSGLFQSILVAADRYRAGDFTNRHAIELAKRLQASLRVIYVVDFEDLRVLAPGPPHGALTRHLFRGTPAESMLVGNGRQYVNQLTASCRRASITCTGEVLVGSSELLWAEEARSCDIVLIVPASPDFLSHWMGWFGNVFWGIATRSCRPVLILRQTELPAERMVLFYSSRIESARSLLWVSTLCSDLGMSLTVYSRGSASRRYSREKEWSHFFDSHEISARFEQRNPLEVLRNESREPGSELGSSPVLAVFDRGFHKGFWFQRHRRVIQRLVHEWHHSVLLCP